VPDRPPPPSSLLDVAQRVEGRLRALLDAEEARWSAVDPGLTEPVDALRSLLLSGGKRLRPAFCHWAYVGAGGTDDALLTDVGAALELLHGFALIHDDVMDGSDRRRGVPTAHRTFGDRHDRERWRGESRRFGEGVAILVGDLAFVYADSLLNDVPRPARDVWDELRVELNIGQYLDMLGSARGDADVDAARRIATYKSAKYTVERPLHLGAALAGRLDELAGPLTAYGIPLGEAFQLRDDLLGAFGDEAVTGKPVGDDLREGKPTPLLAVARARANGAALAVLDRVGDPALDPASIAAVQEVLVTTGAADEVERRIEALTEEAVAAAGAVDLDVSAREALAELAAYVAWRDR
jgi:geranylgeranyl diphosphate synthase, type I